MLQILFATLNHNRTKRGPTPRFGGGAECETKTKTFLIDLISFLSPPSSPKTLSLTLWQLLFEDIKTHRRG